MRSMTEPMERPDGTVDLMAQALILLLSDYAFPLHNEKELQARVSEVLDANGIEHKREVRLNGHNIIDFTVGLIGIEIKLRESKMKIFEQLNRYAEFDEIGGLILLTNTPMGLPGEIKGKPAYYLPLGRAWL